MTLDDGPAGQYSAGPLRRTGWLMALAIAIGVALLVDPLLRAVAIAGRHLPPHALDADYLTGVIWSALLAATLLLWPVPLRERVVLLLVWAVKVVVTLVLMLPYEWNYPTLDAYGYFTVAQQSVFDWSGIGIGNGTENIDALTWLHNRLLPGSYHAAKVSFSFCGLVAVYCFWRAATMASEQAGLRLLAVLALFPSILFWSSILGKDPVILFGIGLHVLGVVGWWRHRSAAYVVLAVLGLLIAVSIRLWLGVILTAPLALMAVLQARSAGARLAWLAGGALAFAAALRHFWQRFAIETIGDLVTTANTWSQGWAEGGSAQVLQTEFTGIASMIAFVPRGMFAALVRPLPGEVLNPFGVLAGLENLLILILVARAALRARGAALRHPLVIWAGTLVLVWAAIYGFVSYQNLGTAVRFRLQILPILLLLLLALGERRQSSTAQRVGA